MDTVFIGSPSRERSRRDGAMRELFNFSCLTVQFCNRRCWDRSVSPGAELRNTGVSVGGRLTRELHLCPEHLKESLKTDRTGGTFGRLTGSRPTNAAYVQISGGHRYLQ